jgi:hypothetical protein
MKRKDYERPTMKVFQLQHKCQILAGSVQSRQAAVEDYGWNEYEEE